MAGLADAAIAVANRVLGDVTVVADRSWSHGDTAVIELATPDGGRYFAKANGSAERFGREVHAYERWVPSLGDRAPVLVGIDPNLLALVITAIGGRDPTSADLDGDGERTMYREAGRLLAAYHQSERIVPSEPYIVGRRRKLDEWIAQARPGLLSASEVAFVRALVEDADSLPEPDLVPCHRDYWRRNWLLDGPGTVRVFDFESSAPGVWVEDILRMSFREWPGHDDLADAFFDGYGRRPDPTDRAYLRAALSSFLVSGVAWPDNHGDAEGVRVGRAMFERVRAIV